MQKVFESIWTGGKQFERRLFSIFSASNGSDSRGHIRKREKRVDEKRQRTAALQNLAELVARNSPRQSRGRGRVRLSSAALTSASEVFGFALGIFLLAGASVQSATYVPDLDRISLLIGQDVASVTNYVATVGKCPAGIMTYTSTVGAEGLWTPADNGAGTVFGQYFVTNSAYNNTVIQLGLWMNGDLGNVLSGMRNANLDSIANWIRNAGRPVYLRIGYEFDAPWNALDPVQYIAAYRYIVDRMRSQNITNMAFVWHSACAPTFNGYPISAWYPGDNYVDWAGISVFHQFDGTLGTVADIDNFCAFAKAKNKPIMIAESTPYGGISDARWANWFMPCLELIHRHHIQMWCYINTAWDLQPLFAGQGWGDSRIQMDSYIQSNWLATISSPEFLQRSAELYPRLHANATNCWREAETATMTGSFAISDASASGGTVVAGLDSAGKAVTFNSVNPAMQFVLRYSANNAGTIGLYVNSQPRRTLPIAASGGTYRDLLVHASIPEGSTVKFQFDTGDVPLNLDWVMFRGYEDSDHDGLPDDWERWRFGSLNYGPNDDPDGDGSSNYAEFVADTNPLDQTSALRISNVNASAGGVTVTFQPPTNRTCFLQQSTDLKNWTVPPTTVETNSPQVSAQLSNLPPAKGFFRLHVP